MEETLSYEDLVGMELHQVEELGEIKVTRVPGGWIYGLPLSEPCFVPLP